MRKTPCLIVLLCVLSGCCAHPKAPDGYYVGLDCIIPAYYNEKACEPENPGESCDEQVNKINQAIKARNNK